MTRPTIAALQAQIGQMLIDQSEQYNKDSAEILALRTTVKGLERRLETALSEAGGLRNEAMQQREECCKLRGMIEMLERLGTIPRAQSETQYIDPHIMRGYMSGRP